MNLIEVKNLEKIYENGENKTVALGGVSFSVEKGEFIAIMGPSGSGKSTLLHLLGFLDRQTAGTYKFDEKQIDEYSEDELAKIRNKKIGFVFQAFNLLARASVYENVKLPLFYSDIPEEEWDAKIKSAVEAVGMSNRLTHEPGELSGGEKQRAAIARSLVLAPEMILADEPTGNLDSKNSEAIIKLLDELNRKTGRTIILITHEESIAKYAQRFIRMMDGKIENDKKI
ncbi:macrolide ABC transporter ATP-binding protein [Candidatus Giovannonibacteria bacterium RIFCSPLOWO2_02_FULL_43_11b]|uniref:Macrolide ABC transporter ATP-binding protein n=1 Tax=Candidatus Giovannonibacteria bacterium RIFCSPHIGHO2_12_FULL_43_15 TaxID=1798341 RepID=A0A1F5WNI4_9BACT|nr:MAG: macrolide ABC transporter ATP-binding protein [Candidatus Giovannonibacteria bacterium RIFCSPHIGHO2_12_FULL_43_15]OGF89337.1 MAG: macrolide ABC transporter ATP-binding protein [Candidatus Giovannonibacteria bacterium RIFCSPLOWO2_02_FULL_43_11b]OGF92114.1 MAG: macrolide ABC transporter ATP-binding protein [Candidatus Giovannonibacteria bacterium RIFCSPLOWO2_12_FULL_43_11c]